MNDVNVCNNRVMGEKSSFPDKYGSLAYNADVYCPQQTSETRTNPHASCDVIITTDTNDQQMNEEKCPIWEE